MKTIICTILTTLSISAYSQPGAEKANLIPALGKCTSIVANYFEATKENPEGLYHAGDSDNLTDVLGLELGRVKAGELVNHVATQCGGKGGGRADMAQAGGTLPDNLPKALASVAAWVASKA